VRRRVSCPDLVGRTDEIGRLRDALARAAAGEPSAVVVSGEAGIGKTRLVGELVAGVPDAVRVLRGGCVPLAEELPYAPVVDLLLPLGRAALLDLAGSDAAVLAGLLPDLTAPTADVDRHRLFVAVRRLLERLSRESPLVLVLEDLHWADPSTLALLAYLVHGLRPGGRLLVVATYRSDELSRRHPLRSLLAELDRGGVARIELGRLSPAETAAQVAGVLAVNVEFAGGRHSPDQAADSALAEQVYARCDGNPFLVEELLAAGPDADRLPESTRDILLHRIRRLPAADQRLLYAVAVAGRRADHEILARVVELPDEVLLERLGVAVDEQILVTVDDGYAFRHALTTEALLAEALPGERVRLHRAYAEALAERGAAAAELAHHWCRAGDPVRCLAACVDAGLAAERVYAQAEARVHFDRAIELWDEAPQAREAVVPDLVELCRHGAEAAYLDGDTDHAIALVRRALAAVDADSDASRAGTLYERLGRYLWTNGNAEAESIGAYRMAVRLVPPAPSAERARALVGLAGALVYAGAPGSSASCEEALRVARAAGARGEEGRALQSTGFCLAMAGDVESGLDYSRQALAIAEELGQSEELYRAYLGLTGVLRMAGRTAEAAATALSGVDVARQRGAERTYGNYLLGDAIEALILVGHWAEADELLPGEPDIVAHGTPVIATNLWLSAATLHTWRGRFDQAQRFLDACMVAYATNGHGGVRSHLHVQQAELCLWQGRYAEASRWVRTELDLLGPSQFTSLLGRLVFTGLRAEAGLTRQTGLPRLADLLHEISLRPDPPPDAAALIASATAELARARGHPDPELWDRVAQHWSTVDMAWPVAYSRWRQAEALVARRSAPPRRAAAAAALAEAYAIATRLGAEPLRQGIAAFARRARLVSAIAPARRPTSAAGLTPREEEVLELLCTGATNRRIARQLFISEKTVSIHVSRILTKLDATNRAEAAAIARRRGLVRQPA